MALSPGTKASAIAGVVLLGIGLLLLAPLVIADWIPAFEFEVVWVLLITTYAGAWLVVGGLGALVYALIRGVFDRRDT